MRLTIPARLLQSSGVLPVIMALSLTLQLLGAGIGLGEAGRGLMAVCLGGQMVQVAPSGDFGDPAAGPAEHCSLCGLALALVDLAAPHPSAPRRAAAQLYPVSNAQFRPATVLAANPARAPPLPV